MHLWLLRLSWVILLSRIAESHDLDLSFPSNFSIGAGTSAYQIEGAWNNSDKGENIWDYYVHNKPHAIADKSNGDLACDSYHKYTEDVRLIKEIGLDFYRFSISWSRILPNGFNNQISQEGIQYYVNLIKELRANGIEPIATIYHWDHPQVLEEMGGWTNELMVDWFTDYARVIFKTLGPLVKTFVTINEPQIFCPYSYNFSMNAPGKELQNIGHYLCVHNILKAHARAYHMYDEEFRPEQKGEIGLTVSCEGWVLLEDTDLSAIDQYFQFTCGWVMHALYIGDYPEVMKRRIATISQLEGYTRSRLPVFSPEWVAYIKGTSDFFGLNHYSSKIVTPDPDEKMGKYTSDRGLVTRVNESWPLASSEWLRYYPAGFGNVLRMIKEQYDNPPVYVLENGYSDSSELDDYDRIAYHKGYLTELISVIKNDNCNIRKYAIWSLLDNFQWSSGYTESFGIVSVDFNDPKRPRKNKLSAAWWKEVAATRAVQEIPARNVTGD